MRTFIEPLKDLIIFEVLITLSIIFAVSISYCLIIASPIFLIEWLVFHRKEISFRDFLRTIVKELNAIKEKD